jgi:SAM-dependent methyltransferase
VISGRWSAREVREKAHGTKRAAQPVLGTLEVVASDRPSPGWARMPPMDRDASRFIRWPDRREATVVYPLPEPWWSRPYEYAWATEFVRPTDVVLDVACGVCHPFKFRLGELARTTYASDRDPRVVSPPAILDDIRTSVGDAAADAFDRGRFAQVELAVCDMTRMPYPDAAFDRVFCISVFEHLAPLDQLRSLLEFTRVLRDDGLLVLTVDHPTVDLDRLTAQLAMAELRFSGAADFTVPPDAIVSSLWGTELRCVRLAIEKESGAGG